MPSADQCMEFLGYIVVAAPLMLALLFGASTLVSWKLTERTITESIQVAVIAVLVAAILLLVVFFQERPAPARNGLWVWIVFRIADAAFLLAAVVMQHLTGKGDFDLLLGVRDNLSWPEGVVAIPEYQALIIGLLLLIAAAGK